MLCNRLADGITSAATHYQQQFRLEIINCALVVIFIFGFSIGFGSGQTLLNTIHRQAFNLVRNPKTTFRSPEVTTFNSKSLIAQPHITAHPVAAQAQHRKPKLPEELQLPTRRNHSAVRPIKQSLHLSRNNYFFLMLLNTKSSRNETTFNSSLVLPKSVSDGRLFMKKF